MRTRAHAHVRQVESLPEIDPGALLEGALSPPTTILLDGVSLTARPQARSLPVPVSP
jgi:hypothetical protein